MKNFKRILAIVLVVMLVVPMMTTGLSAATAAVTNVQSNTGVEIADGNWKAFVYNDWSANYGPDLAAFDNLGTADVSAEGQLVLYNHMQNTAYGLGAYGFTCFNIRNALQSTNTTEINGLYFRNGMMATQGAKVVYGETMSYAFSETQLQGALDQSTYTLDAGFGVEGGMVADGLVITLSGGSASTSQDDVYTTITAYVLDGGKVVSSQSFETAPQNGQSYGLTVGHSMNTFFSLVDGVVTFHVEDTYSADGTFINQTYTFDQLDTASLKADKSYYFTVGAGSSGADGVDGSVNLNLARISDFVINETDGTYDVTNSENKNVADWTGNGVADCEHVWGEYVEVTAPTCTETGLAEAACQNSCGATDTKTIDALGHSWSDWVNTVEPTCTEAGTRERSCSVCFETQSDVAVATGHGWGDWYTTVEPDCVNDGMEQRDCGACGSYEENILPALGHTWVWDTFPTDSVNGARHCETCGTVESDLAYDVSYYWDIASTNKVGDIDAGYADFNDEYGIIVDGTIELQDMSYAYEGPYNKNTMLKATSEFKSSLAGFSVTVDTLEDNNIGTALDKEYPTTVSFAWTNLQDHYDDAAEYSVNANLANLGVGTTIEASRYGHIWGTYVAGTEYTLNVVLSDYCTFWGTTNYGEPDDGEYDWLYYTVVSSGNYWTTKMVQLTPAVSAYDALTVSMFTEYNPESGKVGVYCDINGNLMELAEAAGSQLNGQDYYFSVATYAEGANQATASFRITDVCGESPATFAGYKHEHSYYYDVDPTCKNDGYSMCMECMEIVSTSPATGVHTWVDADCTTPKTCSSCGETEGDALGHDYDNYVCTVCGELEGTAYIEGGAAYATLQDAIDAAVAGDKIVLLAKNEAGPYTIGEQKNITIDLNSFNIRNKDGNALIIDGANVEIFGTNGGTVRSSNGVTIVLTNGAYLTINDPITVRSSTDLDEYTVFTIDETSTLMINALGGRYYRDPVAAGATLGDGLAVSGADNNWTIIEAPVECTHEWGDWVVTVEPQVGVAGEETRTCGLCGATETQEVPALEAPVEKAYTITFDPDGGVMPEGALLELPINNGENYKEAAGYEYPVPTLEVGYVFVGWYWEAFNYTLYKGDWDTGYYAVNESITLVALYEECAHTNMSDWTVTVEPQVGVAGEQTATCLDCGYVAVEEIPALEAPAKDYVITFDPDGGVMPEGALLELPINNGENYKEAAGYEYPVPTLEVGYKFVGWYWEAFNYTLYKGDWDTGYYAVNESITLVALYEECAHTNMSDWTVTVEPQVGVAGEQTATCLDCGYVAVEEIPALEPTYDWTITFDPDGGVMPEGVELSYGINTNDNYKEATGIEYPVPTLDGYVFAGWYWELYNFVLDKGTWDGGYFAVAMDVDLVALYEEAPAPVEVAVSVDNNTITVENVDDSVKDIWVATGALTTYEDVKANMIYRLKSDSAKIVDGSWSYTVAENGTYTVYIRYNDGTVEAKVFVVECNDGQVPAMVQDGATVTFNNLEGLYVLRYVEGVYETSHAIKNAEGVVNVQHGSKKIVNNSFSVTLEPGTYSFVTQFYDGNYVYYVITVEEEAPVVPKDYKITFDPDGGVMPEGVATEYGINYQENYKEATGIEYPVPTLEGYTFGGWYWEAFNYTLTQGDWDGGYFAVQMDVPLVALWVEA